MENLPGRHILVVDDEPKIVEMIKAYLEKANARVFCAYTGRECLSIFEENRIDLLVLDLMLPDVRGEDVCCIIRRKSNVPIIMLTAKVDEPDELAGLGLGADDYITKPFSNKILMARIGSLLRRTQQENKPFFTDGVLDVNPEHKIIKKNGREIMLSKIELNILTALLKRPGKTFSREELIERAMGDDYGGFDRTIDAHIKNLRKKIEDNPKQPMYIITVHGMGYKFGVIHK